VPGWVTVVLMMNLINKRAFHKEACQVGCNLNGRRSLLPAPGSRWLEFSIACPWHVPVSVRSGPPLVRLSLGFLHF
jgi:hypothetical protein